MGIAHYAKAVVAVLTAALVALSQLLTDGGTAGDLSLGDWLTVALAVLGALGVYFTPNEDAPQDGPKGEV